MFTYTQLFSFTPTKHKYQSIVCRRTKTLYASPNRSVTLATCFEIYSYSLTQHTSEFNYASTSLICQPKLYFVHFHTPETALYFSLANAIISSKSLLGMPARPWFTNTGSNGWIDTLSTISFHIHTGKERNGREEGLRKRKKGSWSNADRSREKGQFARQTWTSKRPLVDQNAVG